MSHYIRVISLTVKEGTKLLRTNPVFLLRRLITYFSLPTGREERGKKRHRKTPEQCTECRVLQLTTEPAKHIR